SSNGCARQPQATATPDGGLTPARSAAIASDARARHDQVVNPRVVPAAPHRAAAAVGACVLALLLALAGAAVLALSASAVPPLTQLDSEITDQSAVLDDGDE